MALFYEEEAAFDVEFDAKEVAEAVINQVADMEDVPYEFDIYVRMVDKDTMQTVALDPVLGYKRFIVLRPSMLLGASE